MSDEDQPLPDFLQEIQETDDGFNPGAVNRLSMLLLSPDATIPYSCGLPEKCTNCGACSGKRQSPASSLFQEPSPKRPNLHLPSLASAAGTNPQFSGFTRLPLPHPFPPLRRTTSLPIYSSSTSQGPILNPSSEEVPKLNTIEETSPFPLEPSPHSHPGLYRTGSDPTPAANFQVAANTNTPPRPPAARRFSQSSSCREGNPELGRRESPNTKRLKKMKARLKEMSHWWSEVLNEGEDEQPEDSGSEDKKTANNLKLSQDECETEIDEPAEEAVSVERKGEYLVLQFECPCKKGYQILLCGNNCYYKLTNF